MRRARRPQTAWDRLVNRLVRRDRKLSAANRWEGLEPLENRLMLSAQIGLSGGVLSFDPTSGNVTGAAITIPSVNATPNTSDHTNEGSVTLNGSTSWEFVINNTGDAALNVSAITVSGPNAADFTINATQPLPAIAPGAAGTFSVVFAPSVAGPETASVSIASNDPVTPTFLFPVSGTGIPPALTGATEDLDFPISYAALNAVVQEGATPPTPTYQLQTIDSGTLTVDGAPAVAGTTLIGPTDNLIWHPAANANRTLNAFTLKTWNGTAAVGSAIPIRVEVTPVDDAPVGSIANMVAEIGDAPVTMDLSQLFNDPDVTGPVVQFNFASPSLGSVDVSLFQSLTPATVTNFMDYVNSPTDNYNDTFIHRVATNFVVQGGGYEAVTGEPHIATNGGVTNEFHDSNLPGTISMAKVGNDPNSATSEWFFNLPDPTNGSNAANLDNQDGGFTVFGEVVGSGMNTINTIANLTQGSLTTASGQSLTTVPEIGSSSSTVALQNLVTISSIVPVSPLTYAITSAANPVVTATVTPTGSLTLAYTGVSGSANITVSVTDLTGHTINSSFTVRVNAKPVAANLTENTRLGFAIPINLVASPTADSDGTVDPTSVHIVSSPAKGTLSLDQDTGVVTYTPDSSATGDFQFTYTVTDNNGAVSAPGTVSIHVNELPVTKDFTAFTQPGHPVTIPVLNSDFDPDGSLNVGSVAIVSGQGPSHGSTQINPDGSITYTPDSTFGTTDTFEYTVNDNSGDTSLPATVTVNNTGTQVIIGTGHAKSVSFTDTDGTKTTVTMAGGVATLDFIGTNLQSAQLADVELTNTTAVGALAFSGKGGIVPGITLGSITSTGSLKSITGSIVDLTGTLTVMGDLAALTLGNVDQSTIDITATDAAGELAATFGTVTNLQLDSGIKIKSLTAASITGAQNEITAPVLSALTVGGALDVDLTLAGAAGVATTLGPVSAKGGITGGTWSVTGNASTITAASAAPGWAATVSGDVGAVKFTGDAAGALTARSLKSLTSGGNLVNFNLMLLGGGPATTLGAVSVKDEIEGGVWHVTGNASSISAGSAVAGSTSTASPTGAWIATISGVLPTVKFTGDAETILTAQSITSFTVGGGLHDSTITLTQAVNPLLPKLLALGSLTVKGLANNVDLSSNGNIGTLTLAAADNSSFFAGVDGDPNILPTATGNFPSDDQATIQTVKITGLKLQLYDLINSNIAAWTLGTVTAEFAAPTSVSSASGIAAHTIKSLAYTDSLTKVKLSTPAQFQGVTQVAPLIVKLV